MHLLTLALVLVAQPIASDLSTANSNQTNSTVVVFPGNGDVKPGVDYGVTSDDDDGDSKDNTTYYISSSKPSKDVQKLYAVTQAFLEMVQPIAQLHIFDLLELIVENATDVEGEFEENSQKYTKHFSGFVVCVTVGVILALLVTVVGIICLCCCICGCCDEPSLSYQYGEASKTTCQKWSILCLSVSLMLLCCLILLALIGILAMNARLQGQLEGGDGLPFKLAGDMEGIQRFVDDLVQEAETLGNTTVESIENEIDSTVVELDDFSSSTLDKINTGTGINATLTLALELANRTIAIQDVGLAMNRTLQLVVTHSEKLETELMDIKSEILAAIDSLPPGYCTQSCQDSRQDVENLGFTSSFTGIKNRYLKELDLEVSEGRRFLTWNISSEVARAEDSYRAVMSDVNNASFGELAEVKSKLIDAKQIIREQSTEKIAELRAEIASFTGIEDAKESILATQEYFQRAGGMFIVFSILVFVVILTVIITTMVASCASFANETKVCCYMKRGNCWKRTVNCSLCCQFTFFALLFVVGLGLFTAGGLAHTQVCRYIVGLDDNPFFPKFIKSVMRVVTQGEDMPKEWPEVDAVEVVGDCHENKGLFQALQLERFIPIDEYYSEEDFRAELNKTLHPFLDSDFLNLGDIDTYAEKVDDILQEVLITKDILDNITKLRPNVVTDQILTYELLDIAEQLDEFAAALDGEQDLQANVEGLAVRVRDLYSDTYQTLLAANKTLFKQLVTLEAEVSRTPAYDEFARKLQENVNKSIALLKSTADDTLAEEIVKFSDVKLRLALKILDHLKHEVRFNLGRCGALFGTLNHAVSEVCYHTVDPMNAYWFCLGVAMLLFLPCIVLLLCLRCTYVRAAHNAPMHNRRDSDLGFADVHYTLHEEQRKSLLELNSSKFGLNENM